MTILIAALGTSDLAAQRISFNALSVGFLPGIGFGMATSVPRRAEPRRGAAGRMPARAAHAAAVWVCLWMGTMAIAFFAFARPIMGLFTADPAVADLGARSLRVLAFSLPLWGQTFVWAGGLRGAGNTRLPLLNNTAGMWLGVGLSFLLIRFAEPSLPTIWAVCLPGWAINALFMWRGFRRDDLSKLSGARALTAALAH
jgi:Na+-driven multidrug efflux pump